MALFDFTAEDVARGTILQPGWYNMLIKTAEDTVSKGKGEPMVIVTLTCLDGKDADGNDAPNVPFIHYFSPKAPSFAKSFIEAVQKKTLPKEGAKLTISNETVAGQRIMGYVINDQYEGKIQNKIADFRPVS